MEALTRAAVTEICELVDGGYALLQMEISRKQRENEDLRKKLHLIESIVVRGGGGGGKAAEPEELAPDSDGEGEQPEDARDAAADAGGAGEAEVTVVLREEVNTESGEHPQPGGLARVLIDNQYVIGLSGTTDLLKLMLAGERWLINILAISHRI